MRSGMKKNMKGALEIGKILILVGVLGLCIGVLLKLNKSQNSKKGLVMADPIQHGCPVYKDFQSPYYNKCETPTANNLLNLNATKCVICDSSVLSGSGSPNIKACICKYCDDAKDILAMVGQTCDDNNDDGEPHWG